MNPERIQHYIDRMLDLSEQYEKDGNKEKSEYWFNSADEFETRMKKEGNK